MNPKSYSRIPKSAFDPFLHAPPMPISQTVDWLIRYSPQLHTFIRNQIKNRWSYDAPSNTAKGQLNQSPFPLPNPNDPIRKLPHYFKNAPAHLKFSLAEANANAAKANAAKVNAILEIIPKLQTTKNTQIPWPSIYNSALLAPPNPAKDIILWSLIHSNLSNPHETLDDILHDRSLFYFHWKQFKSRLTHLHNNIWQGQKNTSPPPLPDPNYKLPNWKHRNLAPHPAR